jgi:hypothetical protein
MFGQAAQEAARSQRHRDRIGRLQTLAAGRHRGGYARDTGPLTERTWAELKELDSAEAGKRRHVADYMAGCRRVARQSLCAKGGAIELLAERVHRLVCEREGYVVDVAGIPGDREWPMGLTASAIAAGIAGASWGGGATAQRQLARRYRADTFDL